MRTPTSERDPGSWLTATTTTRPPAADPVTRAELPLTPPMSPPTRVPSAGVAQPTTR